MYVDLFLRFFMSIIHICVYVDIDNFIGTYTQIMFIGYGFTDGCLFSFLLYAKKTQGIMKKVFHIVAQALN